MVKRGAHQAVKVQLELLTLPTITEQNAESA